MPQARRLARDTLMWEPWVGRHVVSPHLAAAPLTVIPAMAVLFLLLRRYEGYLDHRRVFFALAVGFFAGIVVAALENGLFNFHTKTHLMETGLAGYFVFLVGYAALEALAQVVLLGSRRFRERKDTPYYGAALGLGFGATWALQHSALAFHRLAVLERNLGQMGISALMAIVFATAICALHGSVGVLIGKGTSEGRLWRGLRNGMLALLPAMVLIRLWHAGVEQGGWPVTAAIGLLAYGVLLAVLTQRRVLERLVPPEIRDLVRRDMRRRRRKQQRGGSEGAGGDGSGTED